MIFLFSLYTILSIYLFMCLSPSCVDHKNDSFAVMVICRLKCIKFPFTYLSRRDINTEHPSLNQVLRDSRLSVARIILSIGSIHSNIFDTFNVIHKSYCDIATVDDQKFAQCYRVVLYTELGEKVVYCTRWMLAAVPIS